MVLVPPFEPEVRKPDSRHGCANFGALATSRNSDGFCRHGERDALRSCHACRDRGRTFRLLGNPREFDEFDCTELKKRAREADYRLKQSEQLRDRAGGSAAGPVINVLVYGPDYNRAVWEVRLYQDEIARKNCDAPPPEPVQLGPQ